MPTDLLTGVDVLVIEDESLLRKHVCAHLESLGADATGVGTLRAARQSVAELSFDFVLLDAISPMAAARNYFKEKYSVPIPA
jgi:DNA-binding response OmpR family regulator